MQCRDNLFLCQNQIPQSLSPSSERSTVRELDQSTDELPGGIAVLDGIREQGRDRRLERTVQSVRCDCLGGAEASESLRTREAAVTRRIDASERERLIEVED